MIELNNKKQKWFTDVDTFYSRCYDGIGWSNTEMLSRSSGLFHVDTFYLVHGAERRPWINGK